LERLITLIGPTAVGKTKLSIDIAHKFNCDIISGDSMQIYKNLNIGTAKVTEEEARGIPHYLIDIKEPSESYSVADFKNTVEESINQISIQNKIPLIVGGTGLYIQSVLYDYQFTNDNISSDLREELIKYAKDYGNIALHEKLRTIDEEAALNIHPNNVSRVARAIERLKVSNVNYSEASTSRSDKLKYNCALIGLTMDRELLYERINQRVDVMLENGLLDEALFLYQHHPESQAAKAIGYKEFFHYFNKEITLDTAIEQVKKNSRNYAKRQMTWFRNKMPVEWFDVSEGLTKSKTEEIFRFIEGKLYL
jgi:tRNA dimethylallyltransferase